mgnify:CR=1 FL=1
MGNVVVGGMSDVLRIQMERAGLEDNLASLLSARLTVQARFNALLTRPSDASVCVPDSLTQRFYRIDGQLLLDSIFTRNPMLAMLEAEGEAYRAKAKMDRRMSYPMIGIGLQYSVVNKVADPMGMPDMNGKDMVMPMVIQLVGAVANIIFDPILIFNFNMGVAGAAYATVGGQILSMIVGFCILFFGNHAIAPEFKGFRFHGKTMKDIYVVGLPSIVMSAIGTLMTMAMNGILAGFSAVAVNVFGVYFKLQSFVFMPVFGLTQGLMPIMGYNYGARDKKRVTGAVKIGCVIALIIEIAGLIVFEICPGTLISIFNATPELHEIGDSALRIIAIHFPMAAIGIALSTLFQATGHGMYSLVQSVMRQLVVLVPAAWLLSKISLGAVWFCFPISEFISLIVTVVFFVILYNKEIKNLDKPVNSAAATESVKG